ncbi:DUF222 domain-containing protein [Microbacterium sp. NPDC019599]|uniref:HNH endonuclease signature motif containing protein n=1 Tax=Microbacterium sp. NPDC019599 TaxID=3154690 RepID=UPI0033DE3354
MKQPFDEPPPEEASGAWQPDREALDVAALEVPDSLERVAETADMMAIYAAQQYVSVDHLRREVLGKSQPFGNGRLNEVAERSVRLEVAARLRITEYSAQELLRVGEALVHRYPAVLSSLSRADITERHASILVDGLDELEPELRDEVLPQAVALAESEPVGTFRRRLRKLIDTARFETLAERHEAAVAKRRVFVDQAEDGMAYWGIYGPAVEVHAIHERTTAMAKVIAAQPGETRTLDQIRADIASDLLLAGRAEGHPEQAQRITATVVVTVPALALLEEGYERNGGEPPVVEGLGPIPIERARELVGSAPTMMRVLTHPETGMVLSVGRDRYETPPWLRRLVTWRAERCMAPGCSVPASRCDIDHSVAWEHGGQTSLCNLCPLCRGHHTIKHHGDWIVRQLEGSGGALEWISPLGRRYVVQPERKVPVFKPLVDAGGPAPF